MISTYVLCVHPFVIVQLTLSVEMDIMKGKYICNGDDEESNLPKG